MTLNQNLSGMTDTANKICLCANNAGAFLLPENNKILQKLAKTDAIKTCPFTTAGGATVTFASDGTVTASEYSGTLVGYRYMTLTEVSEQLASTQSALADADALNLDQDYRLTLLELGVTDDETTA